MQSVIIGIFTVVSIIGADTLAIKSDMDARHRERHEDVVLDPRQVKKHQYILAVMFFNHYGIFQLAYYDFIINGGMFGQVPLADPALWLSCGVFFAKPTCTRSCITGQGSAGARSTSTIRSSAPISGPSRCT